MEDQLIGLELVTGSQIDEVTNLWDDELNFVKASFTSFNPSNPFYRFISDNRSPLPVRSILACVRKHWDAFAIIESPYLDLEFWDSHIGYYGTCFSKYRRECFRIHFFSGSNEAGKKLIEELCNGKNEDVLTDLGVVYRGYSVFRPIPSFVVGRTAIEFDARHYDKMPSSIRLLPAEKNGIPFLKAVQKCKATILNATLKIDAPEFIQQDPHLGHCGTASLWVSTNISSTKFGTSHFRFPTITRHAVGKPAPNQHTGLLYNPLDPNTGLSLEEIKNALSATGSGYQEVCQGEGESESAALMRLGNFIYSYIESGLPVLLLLQNLKDRDGHVVAAIGHSLPKSGNGLKFLPLKFAVEKEIFSRHYLVSTAINLYYVHDDCYGPYNRVVLQPSKEQKVDGSFLERMKSFCFQQKEADDSKYEKAVKVQLGRKQEPHFIAKAIVPVHFRIRNNAWNSLVPAVTLFEEVFGDFFVKETAFLWRSYLITGSDFKKSLKRRGYSEKLMSFYARIHLPKYIWVHELTECVATEVNECFTPTGTRLIDGEFIYDATSPSYDVKLISRRLYGSLWEHVSKNYNIDDEAQRCRCYTDD